MSACRGFDARVRQHSFVDTGHEIISTAILSVLLIQVGRCQLGQKQNACVSADMPKKIGSVGWKSFLFFVYFSCFLYLLEKDQNVYWG